MSNHTPNCAVHDPISGPCDCKPLRTSVERQAYDALAAERDRYKAALEAAQQQIAQRGDWKLPPLPEAHNDVIPMDVPYDVFTSDQMRAYARAALAQRGRSGEIDANVGTDEGMAFEIWAKNNIGYASTVSAWAAWLARASLAKSFMHREAIYQVSLAGDTWMDTDQDHYEGYSSVHRRTLYTAPPAAVQPDSGRDAALLQNAELVHERLKDIRHLGPGTHAGDLAKEALPCIRAVIAAMAAQQGEKG